MGFATPRILIYANGPGFSLQFIVASLIVAASCGRLENTYLPPSGASNSGGGQGLIPPNQDNNGFGNNNIPQNNNFGGPGQNNGFGNNGGIPPNINSGNNVPQNSNFGDTSPQGPAGQQQPQQPPIAILSYENMPNIGDGSYKWSYETENGIKAEEQGELKNKDSENPINSVRGSYSYTGPDGVLYEVTYIADENGFRPQV